MYVVLSLLFSVFRFFIREEKVVFRWRKLPKLPRFFSPGSESNGQGQGAGKNKKSLAFGNTELCSSTIAIMKTILRMMTRTF